MVESEDELHSLLKVKQESKKSSSSFKLNIQKTEIMACSPITSWQIEEENVETVTYFIFLGFKITADSDCSLEIKKKKRKEKKKNLLLEKKAITHLDSVLKSRDITLPTKVHIGKAMVLPGVMYRCESWTIEKAQLWRTDSFESYWRRFLRVSLGCQEIKSVNPKGNQPWIFIGSTNAEAEAPILWSPDWEERTHWKRLWCWERLKSKAEDNVVR